MVAAGPRIAGGLRDALGLQNVRVLGVDPDTHFAHIMIEADYRMKLIGIALEQPAVPIKKSVMSDYIVCLEDGKKLKMLKRHLKTRYNMTPEDYRKRWGLADDYPMVAPAYAEQRSSLAKKIGLGTKPRARGRRG